MVSRQIGRILYFYNNQLVELIGFWLNRNTTIVNFKQSHCSMKRLQIYMRLTFNILIVMMSFSLSGQTTYFVSTSGDDMNAGTSWISAFATLQQALNVAMPTDEIWVAEGTYYPDEGAGAVNNDRTETFQLKSGVAIYGGFVGTESMFSERDWVLNPTILSGDIDGDMDWTNNSYHVVNGSGTDGTAILDGFTVIFGNADEDPNQFGGGMYISSGSPTILNCTFNENLAFSGGGLASVNSSNPSITNCAFINNSANSGGGISNINSSPLITNCTFINNSVESGGGGMLTDFSLSNPTINNCTFKGNTALFGGGITVFGASNANITNCIFSGNLATRDGGGMYILYGGTNEVNTPVITNCTFSGNLAEMNGGGLIIADNSTPIITNCIFWNNSANDNTLSINASISSSTPPLAMPTISYSLIANSGGSGMSWPMELGMDGGNNIDTDPVFVEDVDPATAPSVDGNLRLTCGSTAIDAGNNAAIMGFMTDLDGNDRIFNDIVDMGAFELQDECIPPIPTLSQWGIITLILLLIIIGLVNLEQDYSIVILTDIEN